MRQLNIYGFQKLKNETCCRFRHHLFQNGYPEHLELIKRNVRKTEKFSSDQSQISDGDFSYRSMVKQLESYKLNLEVLRNVATCLETENKALVLKANDVETVVKNNMVNKLLLILFSLVEPSKSDIYEELKIKVHNLRDILTHDMTEDHINNDLTKRSQLVVLFDAKKFEFENQLSNILAFIEQKCANNVDKLYDTSKIERNNEFHSDPNCCEILENNPDLVLVNRKSHQNRFHKPTDEFFRKNEHNVHKTRYSRGDLSVQSRKSLIPDINIGVKSHLDAEDCFVDSSTGSLIFYEDNNFSV